MIAERNQLATRIAEILKSRIDARSTLGDFSRHVFPGGNYKLNWHHKLICQKLDLVAQGKLRRLMVFAPPRHGKTQLISKHLPAYILGQCPDAKIASASYSASLAASCNRDVQRIIDSVKYHNLFPATRLWSSNVRTIANGTFLRNSDEFEIVNQSGYYKSVGVQGGLSGRGYDLGLIDDPIKDRIEANSMVYRERVWDWYTSVFYTRRQGTDAAIVIILTRWHEDDLAGRILKHSSEKWDVLTLRAIREEEDLPYDPRKPGEALWPEFMDAESLAQVEHEIGPYDWAALYQQRPSPKQGGMFDKGRFNFIEEVDQRKLVRVVRYWDKAGTQGAGCYTSGVKMGKYDDGRYVVLDVQRGRWAAHNREAIIKATARLDGLDVPVYVEQEPGSGGKESAEATIRNLAGHRVHADKVTGSKDTRAYPYSTQQLGGNVDVLNRPWAMDFINEHELYPMGSYKDQVDAASGAFNSLTRNAINPHVGTETEESELARIEAELRKLGALA